MTVLGQSGRSKKVKSGRSAEKDILKFQKWTVPRTETRGLLILKWTVQRSNWTTISDETGRSEGRKG